MELIAADVEAVEALADALASKVAALLGSRDEDGWMTSAQAADYLAVPISTLRKWTAAGTVPFTQDVQGGRCYFKRSELDHWRLQSAQGPPVIGPGAEVK
jgi:excisionase family DNA binding protein